MEREMEAELRFHVEARAEDLMRECVPPAKAMRRARLEFGGMDQAKEECRQAKRVGIADRVIQDLRFGWRMLRKSPGFTAIAVLTLALGIGANTAIFSIVHAVMLSSLPIQDPNGLRVIEWLSNDTHNGGTSSYGDCLPVPANRAGRKRGCSLSYPMFQEMRRRKEIFSAAAAFAGPTGVVFGGVGQASVAQAGVVSGDYFQLLGVNPARGRVFDTADESRGAEAVVVLNYGYWQKKFHGSEEAIGTTIRLNNSPFRIIGVADAGFTRLTPGKAQDLWVPLTKAPEITSQRAGDLDDSANWWLVVVARLKDGIGAEQAQAAASLLFRNSVMHGEKPIVERK